MNKQEPNGDWKQVSMVTVSVLVLTEVWLNYAGGNQGSVQQNLCYYVLKLS